MEFNNVFNFQSLPTELQTHVLSHLSEKELATTVSLVCKKFFEISRSNILWKEKPRVFAHKHIKQLFEEIEETDNHFNQLKIDFLFLKSIDFSRISTVVNEMNLSELKSLCLYGFRPSGEILERAFYNEQEDVIKFIMQNYKKDIKAKLKELKRVKESKLKTSENDFKDIDELIFMGFKANYEKAKKIMKGEKLSKIPSFRYLLE